MYRSRTSVQIQRGLKLATHANFKYTDWNSGRDINPGEDEGHRPHTFPIGEGAKYPHVPPPIACEPAHLYRAKEGGAGNEPAQEVTKSQFSIIMIDAANAVNLIGCKHNDWRSEVSTLLQCRNGFKVFSSHLLMACAYWLKIWQPPTLVVPYMFCTQQYWKHFWSNFSSGIPPLTHFQIWIDALEL